MKKRTLALAMTALLCALCAFPAFGLGGVTDTQTPRQADEARLKWSYRLKSADDWGTNVSDPVLIGDNVFVAVGSELLKLSGGELADKTELTGPIDFTCRPLAQNGTIYIPLSEGRLQAIDAATLQSKWVTNALPEVECSYTDYDGGWNPITVTANLPHQSQTTLTSSGGLLYFGTACADWVASYHGVFLCVDSSGSEKWRYTNTDAGYYWSGAAFYGGAVIFAGDDGILTSLNKTTGAAIDTINLGAPVRSTIVVDGTYAFAAARDGALHKIALNADGSFGAKTGVSFAADSTSTPAIAGGKACVGGTAAGYSGVLAVIGITGMTLEKSVPAPAPVQASPLVSTAYGTPYVYYTANAEPGALYVCDGTAASALFTPAAADQNYCMSSVAAGGDGTLYYTNDSGKLFAIEKKADEPAGHTWLDKLPDWLSFIRGWKPWLQTVVYYVFFGWVWEFRQ
ncbi:MAG: PQQ-binding-like beta-propeller repeat protein [Oscillospiraceae bacterium]|nr:PQQ-binding-like beta-propeller repeat protein [Oscillospiraceae bacterium]